MVTREALYKIIDEMNVDSALIIAYEKDGILGGSSGCVLQGNADHIARTLGKVLVQSPQMRALIEAALAYSIDIKKEQGKSKEGPQTNPAHN